MDGTTVKLSQSRGMRLGISSVYFGVPQPFQILESNESQLHSIEYMI